MKCHNVKRISFNLAAACCATILTASVAPAAIIVNDSWADGSRAETGGDPLDSNWWTSASSAGIEVSVGSLGMVTGATAGRGIHTIFPTQALANVGDSLIARYTFTTPTTIGTNQSSTFRVGLFDTLGRAGLDADVTASTGSPNSLYGYFATSTVGLPGYMMDMDVGTGTEDLNFRQLDTPVSGTNPTGRLMGTTTGFTNISPSGPDGAFTFTANTTYTGSLKLTRVSATDMQITGTQGSATHTVTDAFDSTSYGMLAFWANSATFGSSSTANTADNGIDFSNVQIEFIPVPEPATFALVGIAVLLLAGGARRRVLGN